MALIKCPECGKEISDKATSCIHCGYPLHTSELQQKSISSKTINKTIPFFSNKDRATTMRKITLLIFIPLISVGMIFGVTSSLLLMEDNYISYACYFVGLIFSFCMTPSTSYIEVFPDVVKGRPSFGKEFSIPMDDITDVSHGGKQIIIYTRTTKYTANCGTDCETLIAYINTVRNQ